MKSCRNARSQSTVASRKQILHQTAPRFLGLEESWTIILKPDALKALAEP